MRFRCRFPFVLGLLLCFAILFTSCGGEGHCAGVNKNTGTANTSRGARKGNRGGYKSPRELSARDRQKKRIKKRNRVAGRKSNGKANTTGKRGFSIRIGGKKNSGGGGGTKVRSIQQGVDF